ncbi:Uncharacterised protein [Bordetella pertussis]|nr:Uncharacterised protein [Bordetella pertussis]CFM35370.1 Uncharacterised protein [Bordetella pertussis]CFM96035.1 Uncharacterised protein [Bordetella pertussis]CFN56487.1 Uncharacterised protein [Bordetella pertussis]CFN58304.1 Uncharacterised protein [Bordetella pertussis]
MRPHHQADRLARRILAPRLGHLQHAALVLDRHAVGAGLAHLAGQHIAASQEAGDEQIGRPLVEFGGRADLGDAAFVEDGDAVGHGQRLFLVVRHVQERGAGLLVQLAQLPLQIGAQLLVQRRQRLVQQQDAQVVDQRAGQRHALLLAARQLARIARAVAAQLHLLERLLGAPARLLAADAAYRQRKAHVLLHRHVGKQRIALEHHAKAARLGRLSGDRGALVENVARGRRDEPGDRHQGGRLARPGRTEQGQELARAQLEIDAAQRLECAKALVQRAHAQQRRRRSGRSGHDSSCFCRWWASSRSAHRRMKVMTIISVATAAIVGSTFSLMPSHMARGSR